MVKRLIIFAKNKLKFSDKTSGLTCHIFIIYLLFQKKYDCLLNHSPNLCSSMINLINNKAWWWYSQQTIVS